MPAKWPWSELGLEDEADTATVRRAYAKRLKQTRPEDDPEGFARLREAYETALKIAAQPQIKIVPADATGANNTETPEADPLDITADAQIEALSDDVEELSEATASILSDEAAELPAPVCDSVAEAAIQRVHEALNRHNVVNAAKALAAGRDANELSLSDEMQLSDRLLFLLVNDRALCGPDILTATEEIGWTEGDEPTQNAQVIKRLHARVRAERWLIALQDDAASRRLYLSSPRVDAARLLLGKGQVILSRLLPPDPPLRQLLDEFYLHQMWIARAFDSQRISLAERIATSLYSRFIRWLPLALFAAFVALLVIYHKNLPGPFYVMVSVLALNARAHYRTALILLAAVIMPLLVAIIILSPRPDPKQATQTPAFIIDYSLPLNSGLKYMRGDGVLKDLSKAADLFRQALPGPPEAANLLGFLYETGQGVPQDYKEARRLYLDAARRNDPSAQANIAHLLNTDHGGPVDNIEAFRWYMEAAKRRDLRGLNGVGYSYLSGTGVDRDPARAVPWLTAAAEAGLPNAMHSLAYMYLNGLGLPASSAMAYYWFSLAVRTYPQNNEKRHMAEDGLEKTSRLLTDEEKAAQNEALRIWQPKPARFPAQQSP